jgi:small subunit ribosomal protein S21
MKQVRLYGRTVVVKDGNFEKAMSKFKKKVDNSGVLQELRERETYVKPTTERKKRASAARNRWLKYLSEQKLPPKNY